MFGYQHRLQPFFERSISWVDRYKIWLLIGFSCVLGLSAYTALKTLRIDNGLGLWFLEDNPSYKSYIDYQKTYGSDEIIIVMIPSENPLDPKGLARLESLSQVLEQKSAETTLTVSSPKKTVNRYHRKKPLTIYSIKSLS
ncbi:MAG: hypothetical protein KIH80_000380 [Flavobacteriia bacterium]|nr:hypothetical protein [Flavobacteriia bacterium]